MIHNSSPACRTRGLQPRHDGRARCSALGTSMTEPGHRLHQACYCVRSALTLKNRFVVEVPYVPGNAAVQFNKSVLDSRMIFTGPPASAGITTAVLGIIWFTGL